MEYTELTNCRFCNKNLIDLISMGEDFPLAGGFMRNENEFVNEKLYPLSLSFCENCKLLQCKQIINSDTLFKKGYFYYSSSIPMLVNHFEIFASTINNMVEEPSKNLIVELGCNDGVFLKPLKKYGFKVIGVDPSNTVDLIKNDFLIYNDYFNEKLSKKIVEENGQCDIIVSSNSFAHINDMKSVLNGIKNILKPNGLIIIEVHYSKTIIDDLQFDFIYHEHMTYYTVTSFYNISLLYGLTLEDVEFTNIHGNSIRVYLRNAINTNKLNKNVTNIINEEKHLNNISTYNEYNILLQRWKKDITEILQKYSKIYGYGASGRTNIICKFLDLNLSEIIDDSPNKIGNYTPVYHKKIKPFSIIEENVPDLIIILSWPYADDIIPKLKNIYKGKILIPLPNIKLI